MKKNTNFENISIILERVGSTLEDLKSNNSFLPEELINNWSSIIGEPLCDHTKPISFKKGILAIKVDSSIILQEMRYAKYPLLKVIHKKWPFITDLKFRIK